MSPIEIALFLSVLVERFVTAFVTPLFDKFNWDKFWLTYIAWIVAGCFVAVARVNLFTETIPTLDPLAGQVISAIIGGGGANLLHDWQTAKKQP